MLGLTIAAAAYAFVSFLSVAPWRQIPALANLVLIDPADLPVADKTLLTPLRLVDALAKAWLLAVLIPRAAGWLSSGPRAFSRWRAASPCRSSCWGWCSPPSAA